MPRQNEIKERTDKQEQAIKTKCNNWEQNTKSRMPLFQRKRRQRKDPWDKDSWVKDCWPFIVHHVTTLYSASNSCWVFGKFSSLPHEEGERKKVFNPLQTENEGIFSSLFAAVPPKLSWLPCLSSQQY